MSSAIMTIRGFTDYLERLDDDLFKNLNIPTSPFLDRDTLIKEIIQRSDDMEVLYSNPYYMQESIGVWSKKWYRTIEKWCDTLALEYNPLFNYDKYEDVMDKTSSERDVSDADSTSTVTNDDVHTTTDITEHAKTNTDTTEHAKTNTDTTETASTNTDLKVTVDGKVGTKTDITETNALSAYNAATFQPDTSRNTTGSDTNNFVKDDTDTTTKGTADKNYVETVKTGDALDNYTETTRLGLATNNYTDTRTTGDVDDNYSLRDIDVKFMRADKVDDDKVEDYLHNGHFYGKDTPEKYADLIKAELELAKWNLYEHISDLFLEAFIIPVYG